jgi:phosphatidate cytidylyltransferase
MHKKRWITGLIALPFLIFLVIQGGVWLSLTVAVVGIISLWEYYRIVFSKPHENGVNTIALIGYAFALLMIVSVEWYSPEILIVLLAGNLIVSGSFSLYYFASNPSILKIVRKQVQGIVYVPFLLTFLLLIRKGPEGTLWIFFLLVIIFAGDIGAFYVGSYFGKHKLCPAVSPKKTIEGSLGGLASNVILGGLFKWIFFTDHSWGYGILFMLIAGAAGQVGDLFESELKRVSGVKDSGGLLPGHGGFLDRIDALLFAAPVAYFFKTFVFF